jgi:UPF0755 protein
MKKKLVFIIIFVSIVSFLSFKIYSGAVQIVKHPILSDEQFVNISVKSGDTFNNLIGRLNLEKKVGNPYLIKWYVKNKNLNTNIKPGEYQIPSEVSMEEFVKIISSGKFNENAVKVTIPEGYDIEKIASLLQEKGIITKEEFIKSCRDYQDLPYIKQDKNRKYLLEGFLFPDTYEFIKGSKGKDIIDKMVANFENVITKIEEETGKKITVDEIDKIITMASVVEREAENGSERPIVASVFYNRFKINMRMQSCATIEYALGIHKTVYTNKDLTVESPYNTYLVDGLPVGPICNPGKDSIKASVSPAVSNHLYFVSKFDGTKTHFFTNNYTEFLKFKKQSDINLAKLKE